jgi:plastocyanin
MKQSLSYVGLAVLLAALLLPIPSVALAEESAAQTYTVLVGLENAHQGIEVMAFFPSTVTVHVGDTVHWKINTNEIHTVTFGYAEDATLPETLAPAPVPDPSPLIVNPEVSDQLPLGGGAYSGGMANSGLMGREDGEYQDFSLTFDKQGTYVYVCVIHGWEMSATVEVVAADAKIPSPNQSIAMGRHEMAQALARVPAVRAAANAQIEPTVENPDGSLTHHVMIGYHDGQAQVDLLRFFPDKIRVRPGDTVEWEMSAFNDAPHTVTFLNGEPAPPLFLVVDNSPAQPLFYVAPGTLFPQKMGENLTRDGIYSSGVMLPIPGTSYSLIIDETMTPGPAPYVCLLHDESGMVGTLTILGR